MPTPAERKALLFLAGVIVLGASVRVVRAARDDGNDDASTRAALAKQLEAVDSAHREGAGSGAGRRGRVAPARRPPRRYAGRAAVTVPGTASANSRTQAPSGAAGAPSGPPPVVDLDVASQADIESLPRIGPVLAQRIVDDRSANGPFGSLAGFERVRGVGPALAAALAGRVTFSGTARQSNAIVDHRLRGPPSSKSARRERRP